MEALLRELWQLREIQELAQLMESGGGPALVTGLSPVHRAMTAAALRLKSGRPLLMLCADEGEARRQAADLRSLTGREPVLLTGRELHWRELAAVSRQWEYRRLEALYRIRQEESPVIVTTADALALRCIPPQVLERCSFTLRSDGRYQVEELARQLTAAGYTRTEQVEGPGQFALRGGILDVYSPGAEAPVRCEFFDDEVDSLGFFDVATQRRTENCREALLLPAGEVLPLWRDGAAEEAAGRLKTLAGRMKDKPVARQLLSDADLLRQGIVPNGSDRFLAAVYPELVTAMDYLPKECLVCVSESGRTAEALKGWLSQMKADVTSAMESGILCGPMAEAALSETDFARQMERFPVCQLESLPTSRYLLAPKALLQIDARQLSGYGGSLETAVTDLTHYLTGGCRVVVLCGGQVRARNLQELLEARRIPAVLDLEGERSPVRNVVLITLGTLSAGCEYPALQLAVLTEGQLTTPLAGKAKKTRPKRDSNQQKLQSYADLTPGDLVVHQHHGIGRFVGMIRMPTDGVEKDYIKIAYAGSDCLYVPATALDLVSKYIGAGEDTEHTRLNKLGGTEWAKTTHRAKAAAKDLAEGLIKLYAQRQREAGHAFSPDSPWQQEFEDAFDYTETDDQLQAIREIKADMEKPVPMDRLLCGDVGYGKTEVALRAVMKCILDGKQAAILVPTTVLAQQHYATAMNRFRSFPVTVEVLSRFRTPKQTKDILERAAQGKIDLLIGTHRLLAKNLVFKDLGLLVIDEEQRFGVTHKEKLRERVRQVDTLTLSATPIPRTLNMALSGIRDMSTIEEPPRDRQPVQTYVMERVARRGGGHPAGAEPGRTGLLPAQPGGEHRVHHRTAAPVAGGGCAPRHGPRQDVRAGAKPGDAADGRRRGAGAGLHHHHRDGHRHPQREHPHHRGRRPAGAGAAAPDPGPHRALLPPGLRLSHLPPRQGADGGGQQAAVRHPGICGFRRRLPHRHAGSGDPGCRQSAGAGTVRLHDERGL